MEFKIGGEDVSVKFVSYILMCQSEILIVSNINAYFDIII